MDLPDCPPGAEGYQDSVTEVPKKPDLDEETSCTKAEQEFQKHLNSLKIKTEDGDVRCMVERRGRDISGKWIYLCYPCAAICSGEGILRNHISGKKHKNKLSMKTIWPLSIFEEHPYILNEKGVSKTAVTDNVLQKMAQEVEAFKKSPSELDLKYEKYRNVLCHIQESLDNVKAPLLGVEYLVEHPPEEAHYEPSYICVLCLKQGYPRTIVNHLTCFWHRYHYILRHFSKACALLAPFRSQGKYREGVSVIMNRLATRIEDKYGRLKPVNVDKDVYEREKDQIHQWIFKGYHFSQTDDCTFEEVVDADLITSLDTGTKHRLRFKRDPSPPVVAAPSKPTYSNAGRRAPATEPLSDVSDESEPQPERREHRHKPESKRYEPYPDKRKSENPFLSRFAIKDKVAASKEKASESRSGQRAPNYEYKHKLANEQRQSAEELARKALAYHEKNPEKHPLYPDEWKKFWNRRYKEIQAEGKDPSKHDFKPEWIVYWTARMKELHEEELRSTVTELYRRLRLTPPDRLDARKSPNQRKSSERRKSSDRVRSSDRRRSPEPRHRSPAPRRRSPEPRRRSPARRNFAPPKRDYRDRRSPERRSPMRRRSPLRHLRTRSRSPIHKSEGRDKRTPRRARSPLSRRESAPRNHSPARAPLHTDTVLISDDELKPDDGLSPWNSDESLGSLPDARSPVRRASRATSVGSRASRASHLPPHRPQDFGAADHVVATLRLLVALEDYLGSLGPKVVDLLAEALKMEKEKANSSEELLESESAVVLIETAKEKLKGAVQAGLVAGGAAAAVRAAVVRAAATLHEADTRARKRKEKAASAAAASGAQSAVPVAGVGAVDREQIAQQMAAALVAQGKTDVTAEELAQLVDAVVGMAEAKKREAESKKKTEERIMNDKSTRASSSSTASALQLLQSAYEDKKIEKEDVPDAMDGLSDSDLETLLKNFNELSAEEQHSLIAYLKKLEAREPQRVERLRQYVGDAGNVPTTEEQAKPSNEAPIPIASDDDDDYTVEDVFKSATQKVKEDQIRQEMEIVKKSLEETKASPKMVESTTTTASSDEVKKEMFSATDLLALVQASLQSTHAPTAAQTSDVVTSNIQPRSFGDLPEPSLMEKPNPPNLFGTQSVANQQDPRIPPNASNYGGNPNSNEIRPPIWESRQVSDPNSNEIRPPIWESRQVSDNRDVQQDNLYNQGMRQPQDNQGPQNNYNKNQRGIQGIYDQEPRVHQGNFNQGPKNPQDNYNEGSLGPQDNYSQGLRGTQENYNQASHGAQGPRTSQDNFLPGPRGLQDHYGQGQKGSQDNFNQALRSQDNFNQGTRGPQGNYTQGSRGPQDNYTQGSRGPQDNYNQGSRGLQDNYNQGTRGPQANYNQGTRGPQDNYNQGSRGPQDNHNQGSRGLQDNYNQGTRGPQDNYNQGSRGLQDNYNQGSRGPMDNYNQGPQININQGRGLSENFNQVPKSLLDGFNPGPRNQDQSSGAGRGSSNNNFNKGASSNLMGNRIQDNFKNRQDGNQQSFGGQQYGNFDNNFRGRGRGFTKPNRGRGRGYY